jgi:hypothetical protein
MSGPRRLAVFFSAFWVIGWWFLYSLDPYFRLDGYLLLGVAPVAMAWGVWWVWRGFRPAN